MNRRSISIVLGLAALAAPGAAHAESTWEYAVQASATVETSPPKITLHWPQDTLATPTSYAVMRKARGAKAWDRPLHCRATRRAGSTTRSRPAARSSTRS